MLGAIERRDDWAGLAGFAALIEGYLRIIEPEAQVKLVRRRECYCTTGGDRECLLVEDATYGRTACTG